jgi:hypothetical protein
MPETTLTLLAIACSLGVAVMSLLGKQRSRGFKAVVYLVFGAFAGLIALLNLLAILATDVSFVQTAALAYVGFATAILLPAARALGNLTYETRHKP